MSESAKYNAFMETLDAAMTRLEQTLELVVRQEPGACAIGEAVICPHPELPTQRKYCDWLKQPPPRDFNTGPIMVETFPVEKWLFVKTQYRGFGFVWLRAS